MTSANVTNYTIKKGDEVVGEYSQHHMCHTQWHRLWKYTPWGEHTITAHWLDEEEEYHRDEPQNLADFIKKRGYSISEGKRLLEHATKQQDILKECLEKCDKTDIELRQKIEKIILYSPL
jgi:hypothetical protein